MNPTGMSAKVREELVALREENARLKGELVTTCSMCKNVNHLPHGVWKTGKYDYESIEIVWKKLSYENEKFESMSICPECFKNKIVPFLEEPK